MELIGLMKTELREFNTLVSMVDFGKNVDVDWPLHFLYIPQNCDFDQ